ncbi:MAG: hypothetical protein SGARI_002346, partial [Bacillariaceae sp.]
EEDNGSSSEESDSDSSDSEDEDAAKGKSAKKKKASDRNKYGQWYDGCVRLTKPDDNNWLSEVQCYARSDLVEIFAWRESDGLNGYAGRKAPSEGQVAVRCAFCKQLPDDRKPSGCLVFPENLEAVQTKVEDMLRLHFHSCPGMSDGNKDSFRGLKSRGPKTGEDPHQYWIDSARDLGLSNLPPANTTGWGITFRRDPIQPSPCEELDIELAEGNSPPELSKLYLIRPEDRGECTDQCFLVMRQVKVCRFQQSDKRTGSGSRGRDRVLDFPGLACMHCANKNTLGRYFPVSAKNLTDNTAQSLLTHMSSCSHCPDNIKASIDFLSHRAAIQKGELSSSWKKAFFKKIWDRLHTEREWVEALDEEEAADEVEDYPPAAAAAAPDEEGEGGGQPNNMNALIKAAAIWLTKDEKKEEEKNTPSRARSKRISERNSRPTTPVNKDDSDDDSPSKRRKIEAV